MGVGIVPHVAGLAADRDTQPHSRWLAHVLVVGIPLAEFAGIFEGHAVPIR